LRMRSVGDDGERVGLPTVRPATLDDVGFLVEAMYFASVPPPSVGMDHPDAVSWVEGVRKSTTDQVLGKVENSTTYVILADGNRVGRLRVVRTNECHVIGGIQIHPAYQGAGVGTSIITTLLQEARDKAVPLALQVSRHNPDAERLYTRLGFRRTGEEGDDYWMTADPSSPNH
jgi:GNAT superfamily N-acetyltransferase